MDEEVLRYFGDVVCGYVLLSNEAVRSDKS